MKGLRARAARRRVFDMLLFFNQSSKGEEYRLRLAHLRNNREAISPTICWRCTGKRTCSTRSPASTAAS
jgi:hypothetical protein